MEDGIFYGILCMVIGIIAIISSPFLYRKELESHPDIKVVRITSPLMGAFGFICGLYMIISVLNSNLGKYIWIFLLLILLGGIIIVDLIINRVKYKKSSNPVTNFYKYTMPYLSMCLIIGGIVGLVCCS